MFPTISPVEIFVYCVHNPKIKCGQSDPSLPDPIFPLFKLEIRCIQVQCECSIPVSQTFELQTYRERVDNGTPTARRNSFCEFQITQPDPDVLIRSRASSPPPASAQCQSARAMVGYRVVVVIVSFIVEVRRIQLGRRQS